tara:strand:- start:225 stop:1055 length:831 start_codon:yes stop_codon:yes gene_type:complete
MAKNRSLNIVNINNRVFERVKYTLEEDFENAILANSKKIFGDKLLVNFKLKLKTGSIFQTDVKADMLMIGADYSRWWVVEVERIKSPAWLTDHVLPQLEKITHVDYMNQKKQILKSLLNSFDESGQEYDAKKLKDLILFNQPEFLVIVNDYPSNEEVWIKSLYNCSLLVVNIFRDDFLNYVYLKDYRSSSREVNIVVKQTELDNNLLIKNPSHIFDHNDSFFEATVSSQKNNLKNKTVKFKIDNNKRNIIRSSIKLKKGKYKIVLNNKNITLTDYK